jgi:hypothetical protein
MNIPRMFLLASLVAGLLLLPEAAGAQNVQSPTGNKGTPQAGPVPPAGQEKACEGGVEKQSGEVKQPGPAGPTVPPKRRVDPKSHRNYYGQASAVRRQGVKDDLILFRPNTANPGPLAPPDTLQAAPPAAPPGASPPGK